MGSSETNTTRATLLRIDSTSRFMVLKRQDGGEVGVAIPPDVRGVEELRAGDIVTITYQESVVYRLARRRSRPGPSEEVAAARNSQPLPGATLSYQRHERVTVQAINRETPSITVTAADGRTVSRLVERVSDLKGVKPGDRIDITYREAILASVSRAK